MLSQRRKFVGGVGGEGEGGRRRIGLHADTAEDRRGGRRGRELNVSRDVAGYSPRSIEIQHDPPIDGDGEG